MSADRAVQSWASAALAGLALAMVGAALLAGGGPVAGRQERRDAARLIDLDRLASHVECLARDAEGWRMPRSLDPTDACPGPLPGPDPLTGAAYRFEPLDAVQFRLCADFERPVDPGAPGWPTRSGSCLSRALPLPVAPGSGA